MSQPNFSTKLDALKKLQLQAFHKEAKFHRKVHSMETEFQRSSGMAELLNQRHRIVSGLYVPTKADLLEPEKFVDTAGGDAEKSGIPDFWLTVLKKAPILIHPPDELALRHLVDVRCVLLDQPESRQGFVLEFEFTPNEFFTNGVLSKEYRMECAVDEEQPANFDGFEIVDTVGCDIDWKAGAELTKPSITGGEHRVGSSFFNFFNPKKFLGSFDPETCRQILEVDFEVGYYIKERVIPRAVFFFSGEMEDAELDSLDELLKIDEEPEEQPEDGQ